MKRKNNGMYLLSSDIDKLHERYSQLYKKIKTDTYLPPIAVERECEVVLNKYDFEIEELNNLRKLEYETQQAKIEARNREESPWRRSWIYRLFFKPVTNRAQDLIEEEAAQNAEELFAPIELKLVEQLTKLYDLNIKEMSPRQRKKVLKKYFTSKHLIDAALYAADKNSSDPAINEPVREEPDAEPQTEPDNRETAAQRLKEIIEVADNTSPAEAFNQPEPPESEQPIEAVPEQPKADAQTNNCSRRNRKPKDQRQTKAEDQATSTPAGPSETVSEQSAGNEIKLEEVQTEIGSQITIPLP